MNHLLVVSADTAWNEYLKVGLGDGIEVLDNRSSAAVASQLQAHPGHFDAILVDTAPSPGHSQDDAALDVLALLSGLRQAKIETPILLWSRFPAERLSSIAKGFDRTAMLADDAFDTIKAALAVAAGGAGKPRYAKVELEIGDPTVRVRVSVDGKGVIAEMSRPSTGRLLKRMEEKFKRWALWQRTDGSPRYTDGWPGTFQEAGEDVAEELYYSAEDVRTAIEKCVAHVDDIKRVYFRFSLLAPDANTPHPYVHVPFELLYDVAKKDFVRALAPVARRICLRRAALTATPLPSDQTFTGRMLFIKSDAHGLCEVPGMLFGGSPELVLSRLESLDEELAGAEAGRAKSDPPRSAPEPLKLSAGMSAMKALEDALRPPPPGAAGLQIVHFAGHSVQAEDGSVFLILPGREPGQLMPLPIRDFAGLARDAGVHLVLLSSCESSTPEAVFRLAQAGIPAAIGFRWEVDDEEAAYFTGQLHELLAAGQPLARAFHATLCAVRKEYPGTPTFASPMLVVQDDEWVG